MAKKKLSNIYNVPKVKGMSRPEGAGNFDNMDDFNVVKSAALIEGTIQNTPTANKDIANKKYVDDNVGGAPEGTAVLSTGEGGGTKYLREDGDGTSSWQTPAAGGDVTAGANLTDETIVQGDGGAKGVKTSTATVAQIATNVTHVAGDGSDHADVATNTAASHAAAHTVASHSDTTGTGAELNTLTDTSDADALHSHATNDTHVAGDGSDHADVATNTLKDTNVTSNLSLGVGNATTEVVACSDGTDCTLIEADTDNAGLLGAAKWDEIVANTSAQHTEAHTVASHSDTTGTGAELNTLTDTSDADALHAHSTNDTHVAGDGSDHADVATNTAASHAEAHTVASHSDTTATGAETDDLTDNSMCDTLHRHSELSASDGTPDAALQIDATGHATISTDNSSADTAYVPMVLYNTDDTPPAASGFPVGTLYVQYTA